MPTKKKKKGGTESWEKTLARVLAYGRLLFFGACHQTVIENTHNLLVFRGLIKRFGANSVPKAFGDIEILKKSIKLL